MSGIVGGAGSKSGIIGQTELDYEEGTWSPTFLGASSNPTQSYARQYGDYKKVGKIVTVSFNVETSASGISAGSGSCMIGGLPFTTSNSTLINHCGVMGRCGTWLVEAPNCMLCGTNQNYMYLLKGIGTNTDHTWIAATRITNGTFCVGTLTYQID